MFLKHPATLPRFLTLALPGVFVIGTTVTLATRYLFFLYHPEYFDTGVPSISRTAAFAPGSYLFAAGISFTAALIFISWYFVFYLNQARLRLCPDAGLLRIFNLLAYSLGMCSGLFLALLALINSEIDGPKHEWLSIAFFSTQVTAFLFDTLLWLGLSRRDVVVPITVYRAGSRKSVLMAIVGVLAILLLGLYLVNVFDLVADARLIKSCFVATEYTVSILCFAYSAAYYPEVKDRYRAMRHPLAYDEKHVDAFISLWNESMPSPIARDDIKAFYEEDRPKKAYEDMKLVFEAGRHGPDPLAHDQKKRGTLSSLEIRRVLARMYADYWKFSERYALEDWVLFGGTLFEVERNGDICPPWDDDLDIFISRANLDTLIESFKKDHPSYIVHFDPDYGNFVRGRIIDPATGIYIDFFCYDSQDHDGCLYEQDASHWIFGANEIYPRRLVPWTYGGETLFLPIPKDEYRLHIGTKADHPCQAKGKKIDLWPSIDFPPYTNISPLSYYYFNFLLKHA